MKNILIVKTGASGDVLRTTFVLEDLSKKYKVYWLTDPLNVDLIDKRLAECYTNILGLKDIFFEKIYSLEEDKELVLSIQTQLSYKFLIGCYYENGNVIYHAPNTEWFDMSLVSVYGFDRANELKLENTKSFQELVGSIFGIKFTGQKYNTLEYDYNDAIIAGDIAIAKEAGNKWPNKNWAYYDELKVALEDRGFTVNYLPNRTNIKEHIADIASHKLIVCGDSLPMHIATALQIPSIALFTCTSPVEIFDYKLITKIVSSKLNSYFYQKEYNFECVRTIKLNEVLNFVICEKNEP